MSSSPLWSGLQFLPPGGLESPLLWPPSVPVVDSDLSGNCDTLHPPMLLVVTVFITATESNIMTGIL